MDFVGQASWDETVQREQSWQQRLRESRHPAFELTETWPGWRMIGDVTWAGDLLGSVGVDHQLADPPEGPTVQVHTSSSSPAGFDHPQDHDMELLHHNDARSHEDMPRSSARHARPEILAVFEEGLACLQNAKSRQPAPPLAAERERGLGNLWNEAHE